MSLGIKSFLFFALLMSPLALKAGSITFAGGGNGTAQIISGGAGSISFQNSVVVSTTAGIIFSSDTFTATNGTVLTSHTGELGATWVSHSSFTGSFSIETNRVETPSAAAAAGAYASGIPPISDYVVEGNLNPVTANYTAVGIGIAARISTTAHTMIFFRYTTSGWQLYQTLNGTSTQIGSSVSQTLTVGQDYLMDLSVIGNGAFASVDGVEIITGSTTVLSGGRIGVRGNSSSSTTGPQIADIKGTSW